MDLKKFLRELGEKLPDPHSSELGKLFREKVSILSDAELNAISDKMFIPSHGWYFPTAQSWAIPLIKPGDTTTQKQFLMLPVEIVAALPAGTNSIGTVGLDAGGNIIGSVELEAGTEHIGQVSIDAALPAGGNAIGTVGLEAGTKHIGQTELDAELPRGTQHIGQVEIDAALPAGTNMIGAFKIRDGLGGAIDARVRSVAGTNWLQALIKFDGTQPVAGNISNTYVDIDFSIEVDTYITGIPHFRFPFEYNVLGTNTLLNIGFGVPNDSVNDFSVMHIHYIHVSADGQHIDFQFDYADGEAGFVQRAYPKIHLNGADNWSEWSDIPLMTLTPDAGIPELLLTTTGTPATSYSIMLVGKFQ